MNELPLSILRSVRTYEPIITDGLTLYPVLVEEYDSFLIDHHSRTARHTNSPTNHRKNQAKHPRYPRRYAV